MGYIPRTLPIIVQALQHFLAADLAIDGFPIECCFCDCSTVLWCDQQRGDALKQKQERESMKQRQQAKRRLKTKLLAKRNAAQQVSYPDANCLPRAMFPSRQPFRKNGVAVKQ